MTSIVLDIQTIETKENYTYMNTVGLKIILDTGIDVSDSSSTIIKCRKPDKTVQLWSAEVDSENTSYIYHITETGDLDQKGDYELQAYVEFGDGSHFYGDIAVLTVKEHI